MSNLIGKLYTQQTQNRFLLHQVFLDEPNTLGIKTWILQRDDLTFQEMRDITRNVVEHQSQGFREKEQFFKGNVRPMKGKG